MLLSNQLVIDYANNLGFDLIGFAKADELTNEADNLNLWLARGFNADMNYMEKNFEKRQDVKNIFASAESVISLGMNYYAPHQHSDKKNHGKISRYAWGKDYHLIIWKKLDELISHLKKIDSSFEAVSFVDTGPVMDKTWAVRAGLGWLGRHSNVINRNFGSWFFIANIISNHKFEYEDPIADYCGTCTACIDACPTDAIVSEYVVDANKCISYQTIENKGEIAENLRGKFDGWIFGCDICQDVCPWNKKFSAPTFELDFYPRNEETELDLNDVITMEQEKFSKRFKDSPVKRTKLRGLQRNANFLMNE